MSISFFTRKAYEAFQLAALGVHSARLQDELGRFRSWAGTFSAHRPEKCRISLEYRLRDASPLREGVLSLLQDLQAALALVGKTKVASNDAHEQLTTPDVEQSTDRLDGHDSDDELWKVEEEEPPTAAQLLDREIDEVRDIMDCLLRLSIALRNPARDDQIRYGSSRKWSEPHDVQHVKTKFPQCPEYLVRRLGKAISKHRQYLDYRRKRHEKPTEGLNPLQEVEERPSTIAPSLQLPVAKGPLPDLSALEIDDAESMATATSYAGAESGDESPLRPPPWPEAGRQGQPFKCPICHGFVEANTESSWLEHVYEDLPPYSCVEEDCVTCDQPYARRKDWEYHTFLVHHKHWICPLGCEHSFMSSPLLEEHLAQNHNRSFSATKFYSLADACARPNDEPETQNCVLCGKEYSDSTRLNKHLGHHLEQLTLFALPKDLVTEDSDKNESNASLDLMGPGLHGDSFDEQHLEDVAESEAIHLKTGLNVEHERPSYNDSTNLLKKIDTDNEDERQRLVQDQGAIKVADKVTRKGPSPLSIRDRDAASSIQYRDAVGSVFDVPRSVYRTWHGMERFVRQAAVKGDACYGRIQQGRFYLMGPEGEILPEYWEDMVQPRHEYTIAVADQNRNRLRNPSQE